MKFLSLTIFPIRFETFAHVFGVFGCFCIVTSSRIVLLEFWWRVVMENTACTLQFVCNSSLTAANWTLASLIQDISHELHGSFECQLSLIKYYESRSHRGVYLSIRVFFHYNNEFQANDYSLASNHINKYIPTNALQKQPQRRVTWCGNRPNKQTKKCESKRGERKKRGN